MGKTGKQKSTPRKRTPQRRPTNDRPQLSLRVRTFIAIVVTLVWAGSIAADIFSSEFSVSPTLHAVMLAVVGVDVTEMFIARLSSGKQ